ncbi:hypothetical protein EVB54_002 [Rhizobium phage RHph_Y67]|nr:hypothetical protein EVB54_002 [Rhizobium phage RHph_Y67]
MARRARKVSSRRSVRNSSGRSNRKSSAKRTVKRSVKRAAPKRTRRRAVAAARAPRSVRIVLETAGVSPVRAGEAVGVGQKVARAPRLKPKF